MATGFTSYDIEVKKAENGVMCRVGCKLFVFNDVDVFVKELSAFLKGEETDFNKQYKNELRMEVPPEQPWADTCASI